MLIIGGENYSFLAPWSGKFVYKGETVSFEWSWDPTGKYRNIELESLTVWNAAGEQVIRGERGPKKWRTADTRLPARRSEWSD